MHRVAPHYFQMFLLIMLFSVSFQGCYWLSDQAALDRREKRIKGEIKNEYPYLTDSKKQLILEGKAEIGFSREEVLLSGRKADSVKKTNLFGADEVWVYDNGLSEGRYYFNDGVLIRKELVSKDKNYKYDQILWEE